MPLTGYPTLALICCLPIVIMNVASGGESNGIWSMDQGYGFKKISTGFCSGLVNTAYDADSVVSILTY